MTDNTSFSGSRTHFDVTGTQRLGAPITSGYRQVISMLSCASRSCTTSQECRCAPAHFVSNTTCCPRTARLFPSNSQDRIPVKRILLSFCASAQMVSRSSLPSRPRCFPGGPTTAAYKMDIYSRLADRFAQNSTSQPGFENQVTLFSGCEPASMSNCSSNRSSS